MADGDLVSTILTFVAIVGIGAVLRATGVLSSSDARPLNTVIIYVGLPAFVFEAVHGAVIGPSVWRVVGVAWAVFAVTLLLAFLAQKALRLSRDRAGGFLIAASLGNTGYLGYPLTAALLGAAAVPQAVFSDVFGTVFALVLVGLPIAARFGNHGEGIPNPVRELATFPAVVALAAALVLRPVVLPDVVSNGLGLLASLVAPLVALGVGSVALVEPALRVSVLQASMPSMMLTLVVGERYGLDTDFIAAAIFVTTVASALTIPLLQALAF